MTRPDAPRRAQEPADRAPPPNLVDREDSLKTAISRDHLDDLRDALVEDMNDVHVL